MLFVSPVAVWGLRLIQGILLWLWQIHEVVWTEHKLVLRWDVNWGPAPWEMSCFHEDDDGVFMVMSWKPGVGFPFSNSNLYPDNAVYQGFSRDYLLKIFALAEILSARININQAVFAPRNRKYLFMALRFCWLSWLLYAMSFESFETDLITYVAICTSICSGKLAW